MWVPDPLIEKGAWPEMVARSAGGRNTPIVARLAFSAAFDNTVASEEVAIVEHRPVKSRASGMMATRWFLARMINPFDKSRHGNELVFRS